MYLYKTAFEYGEAEYVVEKSRFIAHIQPVNSYEEAQAFVGKIKQEYRDATHNVPAIIFGKNQEMQWASDDGEPSGTSGLPMLKMLADQGVTNVALVVTRYFGGIKLGTGGLSRAYTTAAKTVLDKVGICEVKEAETFTYEFDYSYLAKIQNLSKEGKFELANIEYSEKITADIKCLIEYADEISSMMNDLTSGQAVLKNSEKSLNRIKI